jgi:hypothetical protein
MQACLVQCIVYMCYQLFLFEIRFNLCRDLIGGHLVSGIYTSELGDESFLPFDIRAYLSGRYSLIFFI